MPVLLEVQGRTDNKGAGSQHLIIGARLKEFWRVWEEKSIDPWVVQVLKEGYQIPFIDQKPPPLAPLPREYPAHSGNKEKFLALQKEVEELEEKEAIEIVKSQTPGFYNRLFLVPKPGGKWRPVLDVSKLNKFVVKTKFSMETSQTVREAIRKADWMVSLDMKDAYFHVPIHPLSRRYLRFIFNNKTYQFKAMCFGLSTAPQVFTRILAPLSKIMHLAGFRIILYLDDWLILASSKEEMLRAITFILNLTRELGIVINFEKSSLEPSQYITYLGMTIDSMTFWVSPAQKRIEKAYKTFERFTSSELMPARSWLQLLGHMSDLEKFVPGARLRMRPYQHFLKKA